MSIKKILLSTLFPLTLCAQVPSLSPGRDFTLNGNSEITINNRVLLKINGKPISVFDVVKKMDLIFYRQYPQLIASTAARYQFYQSSWRPLLASVIDDQLILADASEKKVEVTDGDVREEMEALFGPDVVVTIDQLGMSFDEAWELLKNELKVRRMNGMMVRSKAMNEVTPKAIREQYEAFLKTHPPKETWTFAIITFRGKEEDVVAASEEAYKKIALEKWTPGEIVADKKEEVAINLSEDYTRFDSELSGSYKSVLQSLPLGGVSVPVFQTGKKEGDFLARIFLLKEHKDQQPPTFDEMKGEIQQELTQKAIARHSQLYLEKLRQHYGITQSYLAERIPENFEPFAMR